MSEVRRPLGVTVVLAAAVLVGVVFTATTLPGLDGLRPPGFWTPVDGWLQGAGYVLLSVAIVLRPLLVPRDRLLWGLLAASLVTRTLGFVAYWTWVRVQQPPPYPSVSDGFWLTAAALLLVALGARGRRRNQRLPRLLALDALVAALTTSGLAVSLLLGLLPGVGMGEQPARAVAVNLAYPVLDVAVLSVVAAMVAAGCRAGRPDVLLLGGIVLLSAVDVAYLVMLAEGVWRPGTPVSALSFVAMALFVGAAWDRRGLGSGSSGQVLRTRSVTTPGIVWTAALAAICLLGLVVLTLSGRPPGLGVALLATGLLVAMGRGLLTLSEGVRESDELLGFSSEERERFAALVEASTDFVAIADLDGRLLYLNPAGRRMVGLGPDADVRGLGYERLRPPEVQQRTREHGMPTLRREGHVEDVTLLAHLAGGESVPVVSHSFVMRSPATGKAIALGSIQRDVTAANAAAAELSRLAEERQQLLTRLVQAQDDERARIAADVHDDSVQALAAVQLRLGLLERQLAGRLEPAQLAALEVVQDAVASATGRLRHLLFDLESPARRTDLLSALEEAASYVLDEVGVTFTVAGEDPGDLPEAVRVTAYRVAKEALVNVRQHAHAGHVRVQVDRDDVGVTVSVVDDGRGIAPGHDTPRPGHLGLPSMRDRAAVAGGRLEVEAVPEGGTRFRVWLPAPRADDGSASEPATP